MDKRISEAEVVAQLADGMTIGIGGWGSRRKPMSLVRAIARSSLRELTLVSFGGPDVGLLCAAGKLRKVIFGFVSLDSIPLDPHFRAARQSGALEVQELDEGMLQWGLYAASLRLPFLPTRAGLGSDVMAGLKTVRSPYDDAEELVAMPALRLDAALVHMNRADAAGNAQFLGPDPFFDDLFMMAAERRFLSCERVIPTAELTPLHTLRISRMFVDGVVEAPGGAGFTDCSPDYGRDEALQREYADAASDRQKWAQFLERYPVSDYGLAEICVVACAEAFRGDGEILASPIGAIPTLGVKLARASFAPELLLSDGGARLLTPDGVVEGWLPYRSVFDVVWSGRRHVMMGATQLDRFGNQNLSCIGPHQRPKAQLIGARGAPGNTINHTTSYFVPQHSARVFVEKVDFVCGIGTDRAQALGHAGRFHHLRRVVTNLGVFDYGGGAMRLLSLHPGVTWEEAQAKTGFSLERVSPEIEHVPVTRAPTGEELALIRALDPDGKARAELKS